MNSSEKLYLVLTGVRRPTKSKVSPDQVGSHGEYFAVAEGWRTWLMRRLSSWCWGPCHQMVWRRGCRNFPMPNDRALDRVHLLAAEVFAYSYDNYANHLGINDRFDKIMPDAVRALERAEREQWVDQRLADALDVEIASVPEWRRRYHDAVEVIDADSLAETFRNGVRQSISRELERYNIGDADLESLVTQICYRAADLSYLLKMQQKDLAAYSDELRRED